MAFQFNFQQNDSQGQQNVSHPVEKKENPIDELKEYINSFLEDKQFDESESELILQKAAELQIDEDEVWDLMDAALNQSTKPSISDQSSTSGTINPLDMLETIKQGDVRNIKSLFRDWQGEIASIKTDNDQYSTIQCLYYMVFAALNPEGIIAEQESKKARLVNNYWRIYWSYIAYMKNGRTAYAEDMLAKLSKIANYDVDNISILETIATLNEDGEQSALKFYKSKEADDRYSTELMLFAKALRLELGLIKSTSSVLDECSFILDYLIYWDDEDSREERKAQRVAKLKRMAMEEAQRNRRYYYLKLSTTPTLMLTADEEVLLSKRDLFDLAQEKSIEDLGSYTDFGGLEYRIVALEVLSACEEMHHDRNADNLRDLIIEWKGSSEDIHCDAKSLSIKSDGYSILMTCDIIAVYYKLAIASFADFDPLKLHFVVDAEGDDKLFYADRELTAVESDEAEPTVVSVDFYLNKTRVTRESLAAEEKAEAERKVEAERKAKEEAERKAKAEAERKEKALAEAKARKDITYTITIGDVTNMLQASMTARVLFNWSTAETKENMANVPLDVLSTKLKSEAMDVLQKLNNGGFVADIFAVNALGEIVNINDVQESSSKTGTKKSTSNSSPNELSVTGAKKVGTLMKDFNKSFPYLGLRLYYPQAKKEGVYTPYRVPEDKTLASVRDKNATDGNITITGHKKIKTLEKEFEKIFGLYAQVCYCPKDCKPGSGYITTGDADEMTLSAFNEKCQKDGNRLYSYGK